MGFKVAKVYRVSLLYLSRVSLSWTPNSMLSKEKQNKQRDEILLTELSAVVLVLSALELSMQDLQAILVLVMSAGFHAGPQPTEPNFDRLVVPHSLMRITV